MNAKDNSRGMSLPSLLSGNPYPGRGIALGLTPDGMQAVAVYFIMGRSFNSRNRIFAQTEDGIRTQAFDESLMEDPSLIIYRAVRALGGAGTPFGGRRLIVTNGDQTDTVYDGLLKGMSFEESLAGRTFEPDAPNYTPRISGVMAIDSTEVAYKLGILKTLNGDPSKECRQFYNYSPVEPGIGHFISTYVTDGDPLPSFEGAPKEIVIPEDVENWAEEIWQALDPDNRVALYVRAEELRGDKAVWECLINAHEA